MSARIAAIIAALTAKPVPRHVAAIAAAIKACELAVNDRVDDTEEAIAALSALTGRTWEPQTFVRLWGWTSPEELAETIANMSPAPVNDLTCDELTCLFGALDPAGVRHEPFLEFLDASYPGAFSSDLIFYPYKEMDAAGLASEVLHRQSLLDQGGASALAVYEADIASRILDAADSRPWQRQWAIGVTKRPHA